MVELLSKDHRILERGFMAYQPFGILSNGQKIRDVSGATVRANVEYLEETVTRAQGREASGRVVSELCQLLNQRIADSAYHVTPEFLKNVWNSYSYEFVIFLGEFCAVLSNDPDFHFDVGKEKFISPLIQTLGRPFTVAQIYRMFPHFGQKFAKGSLEFGVGTVTPSSAVLRMKYTEAVYAQFGPYRKRCAEIVCNSSKAALAAVPKQIHGLQSAEIKDLRCIADGDEYCEWQFTWNGSIGVSSMASIVASLFLGGLTAYLLSAHAGFAGWQGGLVGLAVGTSVWTVTHWRRTFAQALAREQLIEEQLRFVEARHEELREAYLDQEQAGVDLRRKMSELTEAYRQIEVFNVELESRVQARTAELAAANEQLKQLDQLKSRFLAHVSHELRTPLTSIDGFSDNMLSGITGSLNAKQLEYVRRIRMNGVRLARMIADLLDRARIEAGKLELRLSAVCLNSVATDVVEELRAMATAKGQHLELLSVDEDVWVWADADRLSQILTNLLENAIKYTPQDGSIAVQIRREEEFGNVSVIDTGPGIPTDALPQLFDPFFRVQRQSDEGKGLGLGLSIVKELVELHRGAISVCSEEGKGSTFYVTLPLWSRPQKPSHTSQPLDHSIRL
jgi:signal transduction histidine kinase